VAVKTFRVDHSGLLLIEPDGAAGTVAAEYPARFGLTGARVRLRGIPAEEALIRHRRPINIRDLRSTRVWLGQAGRLMRAVGVRSVLIVPVIVRSKVVGSFSLDVLATHPPRTFDRGAVDRARALAAQLAVAIEFGSRSIEFSALRKLGLAVLSKSATKQAVLETIVRTAVRLLRARGGGIYELDGERDTLLLAERFPTKGALVGTELKRGEGLAWRLLTGKRNWAAVRDYDRYRWKAQVYSERPVFAAVLEVKLKLRGRLLGVVFVDGKKGRIFTAQDARLLQLFADYAAIALDEAEHRDWNQDVIGRLARFPKATAEMVKASAHAGVEKVCEVVAEATAKILNAESSGVFLVREARTIRLMASHGHQPGAFTPGQAFKVAKNAGSLTGHAAALGEVLNLWGDELRRHPARGKTAVKHLRGGECRSLLAVPLKRAKDGRLIGLIKLENSRARHPASTSFGHFSAAEEGMLRLFSLVVVAAVEDAERHAFARKDAEFAEQAVTYRGGAAAAYVVHQASTQLGLVELALAEFCDWAEGLRRLPRRKLRELEELKDEAAEVIAGASEYMRLVGEADAHSPKSCDANDAVATAVRVSKVGLDHANIEIDEARLAEDLPPVFVTKLELVEILCNLIRNSQRAMMSSATRRLTFSSAIEPAGRWVDVTVTDTGTGIKADVAKRIFKPGFTGEGGHGFGLAACRELLETRYHGQLLLGSHRYGTGATFIVRLRVA
jgi:signal transduction histidine kinase